MKILRLLVVAVVGTGFVAGLLHPRYGREEWFSFLAFGLTIGAIYALIALGYTMVYGILRMVNFAHGDVFMLSAFIALIFFIILTTAAVLNANGITNINSATEAAEALRPLAGDFTFLLFALGIIGTGMLAIPVLAGSAAYGVSEAFGWHATLEAKAPDAVGFYTIIAAATVIGFGLGFTGIDAIHMLVWSAVLNGIVAVPIMAMMMVIVANSTLMGKFRARPWLIALGWLGTALMALAVLALFWSFAAG